MDSEESVVNPDKPVILALDISSVPIEISKSNLEWKYMLALSNVYPNWDLISGIILLNTNSGINVQFIANTQAINPLSEDQIKLMSRINHVCDLFCFDLEKLN